MILLVASTASASTVCAFGCDYDSVVDAVANAVPGEMIEITTSGDYPATGLVFPENVTIRGVQANTVLSGVSVQPPFAVGMAFEHLVLDCGGTRLTGALDNAQTLRLSWVEVRNCSAVSGAIATVAHENAEVLIENSWIHDLTAGQGGLVYQPKGRATLRYNLICDNSTIDRGGVLYRTDEARDLVVEHNLFVDNTAAAGGVLFNEQQVGLAQIRANTFVGGVAEPHQGGALNLARAGVGLVDNLFAHNAAGDAIAPSGPDGDFMYNAYWQNADEDVDGAGALGDFAIVADPQFPSGTPTCEPDTARPDALGHLLGASNGGSVGAFNEATPPSVSPNAWDDADGDGRVALWDCDDGNATVNDVAVEIDCDGLDNDCNGIVDDGALLQGWWDGDGDGFGSGPLLTGCPSGPIVALDGDCDDADPEIHPGADEIVCTGVDEDCSAATPDSPDGDGDGDGVCTDCDDADPANRTGGVEICDGLDNDCDGIAEVGALTWADADGDGFGDPTAPITDCASPGVDDASDCDDTRADVSPTSTEVCDADATDEDCNGLADDDDPGVVGQTLGPVDGDLDGYGHPTEQALTCAPPEMAATDCNDADATVSPGAPEIPDDGIDQDCDGADIAYTYGNGSCGCGTGAPPLAFWWVGLAALAATRRRPRG